MGGSRSAVCERARVWASLLPDGELSLFERRLLDAHCLRCSDCRRLRDDIGSVTAIVRATPLDEMVRSVRVPSQRFRSWRPVSGVIASAAAAALALVLAVWIGPQVRTNHTTTLFVGAPTIIVLPDRSAPENQAIWTFKRQRAVADDATPARHTGFLLT